MPFDRLNCWIPLQAIRKLAPVLEMPNDYILHVFVLLGKDDVGIKETKLIQKAVSRNVARFIEIDKAKNKQLVHNQSLVSYIARKI